MTKKKNSKNQIKVMQFFFEFFKEYEKTKKTIKNGFKRWNFGF